MTKQTSILTLLSISGGKRYRALSPFRYTRKETKERSLSLRFHGKARHRLLLIPLFRKQRKPLPKQIIVSPNRPMMVMITPCNGSGHPLSYLSTPFLLFFFSPPLCGNVCEIRRHSQFIPPILYVYRSIERKNGTIGKSEENPTSFCIHVHYPNHE